MKRLFTPLLFLAIISQGFAQNWNEVLTMQDLTPGGGEFFGASVAIDGDFAVVGANKDSESEDGTFVASSGSASVYMKDPNGNWSFLQKLVASDRDGGDQIGYDVDIQGDIIVVGAYYEDGFYIFENDGTNNWIEIQKLIGSDLASDIQDVFGCSVSISGNSIVIGAFLHETDENGANILTGAGSAYVFDKNSEGMWVEAQKLVAPDRDAADFFGHSVSISGDYLVCGAYQGQMDENGENPKYQSGAAYFFERNSSDTWEMVQKVVPSNRDAGDRFAKTTHLEGTTAIMNSHLTGPGGGSQVFVYNRDNAGNWNEDQIISGPNEATAEQDHFGHSMDIAGSRMVVGAYGHDFDVNDENELADTGAAFIYDLNEDGQWIFTEKIVASDAGIYANFGWAVGISGSTCLVGANASGYTPEDESLYNTGSAYLFETDTPQSVIESTLLDFQIYPNPAQDYLSFAQDLKGAKVTVTNTMGQVVLTQNLTENTIDTRVFQAGLYLMRVEGYKTQTFIVQ